MKAVNRLFAALALGALAHSANAALIVDTTTFGANGISSSPDGTPSVLEGYGYGDVNKLDGMFDFVTWTHKFTVPPGSKLDSGLLSLSLADDDLMDGIEIGFGISDSGQWDVGLVSTTTYKYDISLNSLLDGSLTITLASLFGDFLIKSSELRVGYTPVPEPATLSLMGLGALAAAFGYRRRAKKA